MQKSSSLQCIIVSESLRAWPLYLHVLCNRSCMIIYSYVSILRLNWLYIDCIYSIEKEKHIIVLIRRQFAFANYYAVYPFLVLGITLRNLINGNTRFFNRIWKDDEVLNHQQYYILTYDISILLAKSSRVICGIKIISGDCLT